MALNFLNNGYFAGKVGIGTNNPVGILDVFGSGVQNGSTPGIKLSSSNTQQTVFAIGNTGTRQYELAVGGTTSSVPGSFYVYDNSASSFRLILSTAGNFSIGGTLPTQKLQLGSIGSLIDSIRIGTYAVPKNTRQYIGYTRDDSGLFESSGNGDTPSTVLPGVAGIRIVNTTGTLSSGQADNSVQLLTHIYNGGSRVALHANYNGNVGIGTTSPDSKLQVNVGTDQNVAINSSVGVARISSYNDGATLSTPLKINGSELRFDISNTEKMRINSSGKVGIGTTLPSTLLQVNGTGITTAINDGAYTAGYFARLSSLYGSEALKLTSRCGDILRGSDYGASVTILTGGTTSASVFISSGKSVQFNGYSSTNFVGTPTYLLGTDASGNIVKTNTVPGSAAGPYLPLAGGTMTGTNGVVFPDAFKLNLGTGSDLQIYHDSANSYIETSASSAGDLYIKAQGTNHDLYLQAVDDILIRPQGGENGIKVHGNDSVELYFNNARRLRTTTGGVFVEGEIKIDSALLDLQENTDVDTGAEVVAQVSTSTYTAAFFDFVIKKVGNIRSGTVYACHDGTNVEFTETSTQDLGDTSDVTLSVDKSGTNLRLIATVTSDDWSIKSLIRAI